MKYNERELARLSEEKAEFEGRLNYKKINPTVQYYQTAFKQRWFKLIDNFLFYFRINELGKIVDKQPIGVFILENAIVQPENNPDCSFSFTISFVDESDKKYIFSCMSEEIAYMWISKLQSSSYEYLRSQLYILQSNIYSKTGKDPLLMVPRNPGAMRWAPGQPFPKDPQIMNQPKVNEKGFISHLPNHDLMVHKSKSSTNVNAIVSNTSSFLELSWPGVERSQTSTEVNKQRSNLFNDLDLGKLYTRAAPSPPPRKKNSPLLQRNEDNKLVKKNHSANDLLSVEFYSSQPPLPPMRRNSPKRNNIENASTSNMTNPTEVNLIEF